MSVRTHIRRGAATLVTTGLLTTGAVALASPASAVGSSACVHSTVPNDNVDHKRHPSAAGSVHANGLRLRTGPGSQYTAKGQLSELTGMSITCTSSHDSWLYGEVLTGAHKGEWGWVSNRYVALYYAD